MILTSANSDPVAEVTDSDIQAAFDDDPGRGEFIILSQSEMVYMQAGGEYEGPYTLEYQQGNLDEHYQCTEDLNKTQVQTAFIKYLNNDTTWQTDYPLEILKQKPWWKLW